MIQSITQSIPEAQDSMKTVERKHTYGYEIAMWNVASETSPPRAVIVAFDRRNRPEKQDMLRQRIARLDIGFASVDPEVEFTEVRMSEG